MKSRAPFKFLSDDNKEGVWLSGLREDCGRFEDWELFKGIVKVLYSVWCTTSLKDLEIVVPFRYFFFSLAWSIGIENCIEELQRFFLRRLDTYSRVGLFRNA